MGYTAILDQSSGRNQFLQMSKHWIEPNVTYDFKLKITENLGTKAWVKENGTPEEFDSTNLKIDKGATFPTYVPNAGETLTTESGVETLDSERGNFGIGVGETKSYEWEVSALTISSIMQIFPMHLFRFKIDTQKWPTSSAPFDVNYYGVGYDPELGPGHSKTQAAIWNPNSTSWNILGEHTAEVDDFRDDMKITNSFTNLSSYIDTEGYIWIVASAANFGTNFPTDKNHNLESYYIELKNPQANKRHLNNAIDVYCHAPDSISRKASSTLTVSNGEIILDNPYIQDILQVQEANSSTTFDESEFSIFNNKKGEEFSKDNEIKLAFDSTADGTQVIVVYRQWTAGSQINTFLNSSENRYPGVTIKEKVIPPATVYIDNLEYTGDLGEEEAKTILKDFINSIERGESLEKSDIVNKLYESGATFVSLDFTVRVKQYFTNFRNKEIEVVDRYNIPDNAISRFFATEITLNGVTNV